MNNSNEDDDICSICHSAYTTPCQANCSHWFCGNCILMVWHHGSALQPCKCPLCRRNITLLVPSGRRNMDSDAVDTLQKIERYNRLFGERGGGIFQRMQDLPFLLKRLLRELMDPQRSLPLVIRARVYIAIIVSFLYVISPVDIIPEALFGVFGLLDDLIVVLTVFMHLAAVYRSVLLFRHGGSGVGNSS